MNKTKGFAKFFKVICVIIFILVLLVFISMISGIYFFKDGNKAPVIYGYRIIKMQNDTMYPVIPHGSLILSKTVSEPTINSIVMFSEGNDNTFTVARVVAKETVDGKAVYKLRADNASGEIVALANMQFENVIYASHKAGYIVAFATSYRGVLACAIIPCGLLILFEIILSIGSKKKREDVDSESPDSTPTIKETEEAQKETEEEAKNSKPKHRDQSPLTVLIEEKKSKQTDDDDDDMPVISAKEAKALFAESKSRKQEETKKDFEEPKPQTASVDNDIDDEDVDGLIDEILEEVK